MNDLPPALISALADRYQLGRVVGRGGMATVYLARDDKHGRAVALKVLRPDLAAVIGTERFLNEIEIAARLNHPHIVPLYDSGEADGFLYYVMPYVEGTSVRGLVNRGQMDMAATVSIIQQVAGALDHAHGMGVLHRDIKPENILLTGDHAYVTDFGIAKAVSTAGAKHLTRSGFPLGTVGYMSPEQAAGVKEIDARSDVYGLACVLYEMLVGDTPGLWLTEEAVRLGRFVDAEPLHRERLDALPGRVEQALTKALALKASDRHSSPGRFAEAVVAALGPDAVQFRRVQVQQIIRRAAELQAAHPTEEGVLSIGAVEQVAAEVGIAPERVRQAVTELIGMSGGEHSALPSPPDRTPDRYNDTEVRQIIERAVQLEAKYSAEPAALTIGGLEEVAAEIGIPPETVHEAAREVAAEAVSVTAKMPDYGKLPALVIDRTIPHQVTARQCETIVEEFRKTLGVVGEASWLGETLVWRSVTSERSRGRSVQVVLTPGSGGTALRIEERLRIFGREIAGSIAGWVGGGLIGIALALGFGAVETGMVPLFGISFSVAGAYVVHRSIYENTVVRRKNELEGLADRIVEDVS
jgi:serine/threonine protein kinase